MADVPTIIEFANLIAAQPGFEPLTPPWAATLRLFYGLPLTAEDVEFLATATGRSRAALESYAGHGFAELWARVGRRGRKSAVAALVADYEAIYGGHGAHLIPGEIALIPTISKDLGGASTVRRFEHSYLDALGIAYQETKFGSIAVTLIEGSSVALACLACTSEAPRGPAIPVAILDEIAFYKTSEVYENPDTEILAALRPAMAQFPGRKLLAISSPFAEMGVFHTTVEGALANDSEHRTLAVEGPTWKWSPTVTEALTHELEPDEAVHSREYGAKPAQIGAANVFASGGVDACFTHQIPESDQVQYFQPLGVLDMSSGGSDATCAGVAQVVLVPEIYDESNGCLHHGRRALINEHGIFIRMIPTVSRMVDGELQEIQPIHPRRAYLTLREVLVTPGGFWGQINGEELMRPIGEMFRRWGVRHCYADKFERGLASNELRKFGVMFTDLAWTNEMKHDAVLRLKRLMSDGQLMLCACDRLNAELKTYQQKPLAGGLFRYAAKGKHHDDAVALCINLAVLEISGHLHGSELFNRGGRTEVPGR